MQTKQLVVIYKKQRLAVMVKEASIYIRGFDDCTATVIPLKGNIPSESWEMFAGGNKSFALDNPNLWVNLSMHLGLDKNQEFIFTVRGTVNNIADKNMPSPEQFLFYQGNKEEMDKFLKLFQLKEEDRD